MSLTVENCLVKRILVDNGSSGNIIFQAAYKDLGLEESALTRRITPLIGFSGEVKQTAREVTLPVYTKGINMSTKFLIVDCDSSYNMILGRPWIHGMGAVPSTLHQMSKPQVHHTEEPEVEEMDDVPLTKGDQTRHLKIGSKLAEGLRRRLIDFLMSNSNYFAWSHADMHGIDPKIIMHKLQVQYLEWLANVVVVKKKNGKWRVCIDFTDLNKSCPKDPFPLPYIDKLVDAIAGHQLMSFMDAF
ncbi:uncharacterized protein LOC125590418 [Brassica napus]|uniref:uncharacterized protein LOC125590418 n=1 Tax=Brassica napus TaxID=3708 RepID=UPI00207AB4A9|nr:uncharacterized protein LOC125590418 [Brassica napus]